MAEIYSRTPNSNNSNNEYLCNPTGARDNNNANNSNGVAPDYKECLSLIQVDEQNSLNAVLPCREISTIPATKRENNDADAGRAGLPTHRFPVVKATNGIPFVFADLIEATRLCKRGVIWKDSVAGFVKNRMFRCDYLMRDLEAGTYKLAPYTCFKVHEPKERDIVATNMQDRVVQRAICNTSFYHDMTKGFIYDNWACQVGKGTTACRKRMKQLMVKAYRLYGKDVCFLKVDIKSYFGTTPHDVAKEAIRKRCKNKWVADYACMIVDSFNDVGLVDIGIGLGSQLSQLIELAVLDSLDHQIKDRDGVPCYMRYMDDIILFGRKEELRERRIEIEEHLKKIGLSVSKKKTFIGTVKQSLHFLGFAYSYTDTGKILMKPLKGKENKEKRKLRKQLNLLPIEKVDNAFVSWKANASQGTDFSVIRRMNRYYSIIRRAYA